MLNDYPNITVADTPPPAPYWPCELKTKQEVENTMFDECTPRVKAKVLAPMANAQIIGNIPVEATQRDYTVTRIGQIADRHDSALRVQFHLDSQNPGTFLELEKLIKDGNYTVNKDLVTADDAKFYSVFYGVTFGKPADKDGFKAARLALKTATQKALDAATLGDLSALQGVIADFEGWVYTPAA